MTRLTDECDALECYRPINTLKAVDENLWIADGPVVKMAYAGFHLPFTTRMTVVRLKDGRLWIHSPIPLTESLRAGLDSVGRVAYLISPNRLHYEGMIGWTSRYADALLWASPGVRDAAMKRNLPLHFDRDLAEGAPPEWSGEIRQTLVRGSRALEEFVFFHDETKTLILADLIENFETSKIKSPVLRLLVRLSGAADPDGKMPIDLRLAYVGRRKLILESVCRLLSWHPKRMILSHGRWYDKDAEAELRRAFRWLLKET